jgi:hypothetical protein
VFAANINDLECLITKLACTDQIVEFKPEEFSVEMKLPGSTSLIKEFKMAQFAVNMSLATTSHKLQGMTMDILILAEISLGPNWMYVVLSRVTMLKGLYLMQPLSKEMFKRISRNLREELLFLRGLEQRLLDIDSICFFKVSSRGYDGPRVPTNKRVPAVSKITYG